MKIKANVNLRGMKKQINRIIQFSDKLTMKLFCEYIILSMNGNCKHLYQLVYNDEYTYLGPDCNIQDYENEELIYIFKCKRNLWGKIKKYSKQIFLMQLGDYTNTYKNED